MKKRVALIAASIFTVLAVLAALIFRDPSDVNLVKGVKPFYTFYGQSGSDTIVTRTYSLHVPYDEAVRKLDKELPSSWIREKYCNMATFSAGPNAPMFGIERERYVTGLLAPPSAEKQNQTFTVSSKFVADVPESDGWITVTTEHRLMRFEAVTTKLRDMLTNFRDAKYAPYQLVSHPWKGDPTGLLPIDSDTDSHFSKDQQVTFMP